MKPDDIPEGDRIYPGEKCVLCGAKIEVFDEVDGIVYLTCPNVEDGDGHTDHDGLPKKTLEEWGWKFNDD